MKNSLQMFLLPVIALMCISVSACDNAADKVLSEGSKIGRGALHGSMAEFSTTIKLDSTSAKVYVGRAAVKYANRDNRGAITDLTKAIELDPKSATAYSARATAKFSEDDISGSMADFMNAAKIVVLSSFRQDSGK